MLFDYGFLSSPDDAYGDDALLAESFGFEAALPLGYASEDAACTCRAAT